jgi:mRNA interferase MazF
MARFISGKVVVLPFPFTDLPSAKVWPAVVLASLSRGDVILCQVTSQASGHPEAVAIGPEDFELGGLPRASFALAHRIVTANEVCLKRSVGCLKSDHLNYLRERVCATIRQVCPHLAPKKCAQPASPTKLCCSFHRSGKTGETRTKPSKNPDTHNL